MAHRVNNRHRQSEVHTNMGSWAKLIRDQPMFAVGAAAVTGFFAGGGAMTIPGRIATSLVTRMIARELAAGMLTGLAASMFAGRHDNGNRKTED